jgi:hypothetical protein
MARRLPLSEATVHERVAEGKLRQVRVGNALRFSSPESPLTPIEAGSGVGRSQQTTTAATGMPCTASRDVPGYRNFLEGSVRT